MVFLYMEYNGIDSIIKTEAIRSVGINDSGGQLGIGVLHKPGIKVDEKDSKFYFYSLVYVIRGNGEYIDKDGNRYELKPGSIFQRFPGISHTNIIDPNSEWAECFIDFGIEIYNFMCSMRMINPSQPVYDIPYDRGIEESFLKYKSRLDNSLESELPNLLTESMFFVQKLFDQSKTIGDCKIPQTIIDRSCIDFTDDLRNRINLKEYCKDNGLGYESFRKVFKNCIGISPGKYIIRRRVDLACQLLLTTNKTIGELSDELGYKSQYEFSSQFKRQTAISPSNYRNSN